MKKETSVFKGKNKIAKTAKVVNSYIENCTICENVEIYNSVVKDSLIESGAVVGPFAHIRDGAVIGNNTRIGTFVEIKKSRVGDGSKIAHMSYVGDSEIGKNCNIGAGVIFCNYDGVKKQKIVLGDWVFVGSNSNLIAPLEIGDKAFIAAGTTVSRSVMENANIIGRARQEEFVFENPYLKNIKKPKWFGTDGIRGVWGQGLNKNLVKEVAKSLCQIGGKSIVLGRDTRPSGKIISNLFKNVFSELGVNVVDLGIVTTPCVSFCTKSVKADFGVMITVSHNPAKFNGIKIFNGAGEKISEDVEVELENYFFQNISFRKIKNNKNKLKNKYFLIKKYKNYIKNYFSDNLCNLKIIIDCANGCASYFAKDVFKGLGSDVEVINTKGEINKNCGALFPKQLAQVVQEKSADLGFAFDGDADRVVVVNKFGDVLDGDDVLFVLAKYFKTTKSDFEPIVLGTTMTNLGTEQKLLSEGIKLLRSDVGDKWVAHTLKKQKLFLGAEQAGHIVLNHDFCLGDGILVARILAQVYKNMPDLFQDSLSEKSFQCQKNLVLDNVKVNQEDLNRIMKEFNNFLLPSARVVVRKSGTENALRVMAESFDEIEANELLEKVLAEIKRRGFND